MIGMTNITSSLRTDNFLLHNYNNNNNRNSNDIESNNITISSNDSINSARIEDSTLLDTIKNDKTLMTLFIYSGFYIKNENDKLSTMILARAWQLILLIFGSIGFFMLVFLVGFSSIASVLEKSKADKAIDSLYYAIGALLYHIIVPILQVLSLMYGIFIVRRQLRQSINSTVTSNIIYTSKRRCIIFFIIMILLVVICNPLNMSRSIYNAGYKDVNFSSYSAFLFQQVALLFFNLATTCYLTVVMFFTSITIKQIKLIQNDIITSIDNDSLTCNKYVLLKEKIIDLKKEFYLLVQILTIIAGVNIIAFVIQVGGYYYYYYTVVAHSYKDMILADVHTIPYIFKEIVFFYYILLLVGTVNTNNDDIVYKLNTKCWQLKKEDKGIILSDYVLMHLDAQSYPTVLKLVSIEVRRGRVLLTLATLVLYCMYVILNFRKKM